MTLEKVHIQNRGPLVDFEAEFGPITVIYGPNASGKSLLSNTLRSVERKDWRGPGEATVTFGGNTAKSPNFAQGALSNSIRVFNADFMRDDVIDAAPGAIVLGRELVSEREQIEQRESELEQLTDTLNDLKGHIQSKADKFSQSQTDTGREIEQVLTTASSIPGFAKEWRHYNKTKAYARYERMTREGNHDEHSCDDAELVRLADAIKQRRSNELEAPTIDDSRLSDIRERVAAVCKVRGSDASLPETDASDDMRDWLRKGLEFLRNDDQCGFCHQTVPRERTSELRSYFDDRMTQLLDEIDQLTVQVNQTESTLRQASVPATAEIRDDLRTEYDPLIKRWSSSRESLLTELSTIKERLATKRKRPNEVFEIGATEASWDVEAAYDIAGIIKQHNDAVKDLLPICDRFESGKIARVYEQWQGLETELADLESKVQRAESQIEDTNGKLNELRRSADSRLIAADELTEMVRNFLGHDEIGFTLNAKEHSYQLTRHGEPANGFSEGERTALSLMYFLKRLEDDSFNKRNGTLVFDDPITSFDEDNLYRAVSDIITRTGIKGGSHDLKSCKVIFLTHHFGLFERLWMELRNQRTNDKETAKFYELRCQLEDSRRTSRLARLKESLITDYMLAFQDVQSMADGCKTINNPETSIRKCVEGFITRMIPRAIDRGLTSAYWSFVNGRDSLAVRKEDLQLIISIANGGSHLSAISRPATSEKHWSTLRATSANFLLVMADTAPEHHDDLTKWYSRRARQ